MREGGGSKGLRRKINYTNHYKTPLTKYKMEYPIAYMVAGLSSRFGGKPKAFAKIGPNQESLIEISMDRAIAAGFNKFIFIVGKETEQAFKEKFNGSYKNIPVEYSFQSYDPESRDRPWGTTDASCTILNQINGPVLICTGDDLYSADTYQTLFNHIQNEQTDATVGYDLDEHLPEEGEVNRGIFYIEDNYVIEAKEMLKISRANLAERGLSLTTKCNCGIFLVQKETLEKLNEILKKFKQENQNERAKECYLNVELGNLIKNNEIKLRYYPGKGKLIGITNPEDEEVARETLKQN